jgi:hypothetical protein
LFRSRVGIAQADEDFVHFLIIETYGACLPKREGPCLPLT